ncbi:MAG: hypothetical protein JSU08_01335 [Acidobacteria bacterium]|nr:hypothetical protein [Acidobacteriota bacterium]
MEQIQECFSSERRWFETSPWIDVLGTICAIGLPVSRAIANVSRFLERQCESGLALERAVAEQEATLDLEFGGV